MTLTLDEPRAQLAPPARLARNGEEFLANLGGVPLHRVVFDPPPGTVTGEFYDSIGGEWQGRLVELVDGTLVRKAVGFDESVIGGNFFGRAWDFVRAAKLGVVAMADGGVRMVGGNRREPDVGVYLAADYPPGGRRPQKVTSLPPRLIVEVLSEDNTAAEIDKKLRELFASGCRLAYVIDPRARAARRHVSPDDFTIIDADGTLDGGDVLPGFEVGLRDVLDG